MKWVCVCVFTQTCPFFTFSLAFLAVCDDEQTGGNITQLEARHTRRSTERDTKYFLGLVSINFQLYTYFLCQSAENNFLFQLSFDIYCEILHTVYSEVGIHLISILGHVAN